MISREELDALWRRINEADKNRREHRKKEEDARRRRWRETMEVQTPYVPVELFSVDPVESVDTSPSYDTTDGGTFDGDTSGGGGGGDSF